MREVALVVDEYGNEIFFGETIGECRRYCDEHHITGENGEYITSYTDFIDIIYVKSIMRTAGGELRIVGIVGMLETTAYRFSTFQ